MHKKHLMIVTFLSALFIPLATGCSANQDKAAQAVEAYFQALQGKDEAALVSHTCSSWEADARTEFNSFSAVKITLEDFSCQQTDQSGDFTLVSCQGSLVASYGAEDLVLDFSERVYKVIQEGGDWRMCGYK